MKEYPCFRRVWLGKIDADNWDYELVPVGYASSFEDAQSKFGRLVIMGVA